MLIMDSVTSNFRVDFSGRGELADRSDAFLDVLLHLSDLPLANADCLKWWLACRSLGRDRARPYSVYRMLLSCSLQAAEAWSASV